jgi:hypothetical protein
MLKRPNVFTWFELNYKPNRDRFLAQVRREGPGACWHWTGGRSGEGEPLCYVYESGGRGRRQAKAARLAFFYFGGERLLTLEEMVVRTCGSKGCVNPAHLEIRPTARFVKGETG